MFRSKKNHNEAHKASKEAEGVKEESAKAPEEGKQEAVPAPAAAPATDPKKDLEDRLLRLQADFDNYRKRVLKERSELYIKANEDIMEEMLPVLDHLDLAFKAAADHKDISSATLDGFRLVGEQVRSVFGKFGLAEVDASGKTFDPNLHEAISHIPSDAVPENSIITQTRKGYMLGARLLRPAQVVVSSGKPAEQPVESSDVEG